MRIAIIGNSGSGKSTLARWLAAQNNVPALDLDTIAWEPGSIAVPRPKNAADDDVRAFCATHKSWVVEGCYANLVRTALEFEPRLLFLNPGEKRCLDNCRVRPWEAHKYPSMAEQDKHLSFLLSWVSQYYTRDGEMSLAGHTACFSGYSGPRDELTCLPSLDPPSAEVVAWINVA